MPFIPVLRRPRKTDLCQFGASLVYSTSHRTARATQSVSKNKNKSKLRRKQTKNKSENELLPWNTNNMVEQLTSRRHPESRAVPKCALMKVQHGISFQRWTSKCLAFSAPLNDRWWWSIGTVT